MAVLDRLTTKVADRMNKRGHRREGRRRWEEADRPIVVEVYGRGDVVPFPGVVIRRRLVEPPMALDVVRAFEAKERKRRFARAMRSRQPAKSSTAVLLSKMSQQDEE